MTRHKKIGIAVLTVLLGGAMVVPVVSHASDEAPSAANVPAVVEGTDAVATTTPSTSTEDSLTVTVQYYENVAYEDSDVSPDEEGRIFLGERVIYELHEGDVLDTWDYVVDIPGHFFFDAWPAKLTVTNNPANNVIKLFYCKLWNNEFTVNYYLMEGADLTADTWSGALAPEGVRFIKLGSETFTDVRYDQLVEGDAYEYKIDGTYVVDTYPTQIRVGSDPDENVINVLYVPDSMRLPDDVVIPDKTPEPDDAPSSSASSSSSSASGSTSSSNGAVPVLPPDATLNEDDLIGILPDASETPGNDEFQEIRDDFFGTNIGEGELVITDEMLANPVDREQAQIVADAYRTGVSHGSVLAATGDNTIERFIGAVAIVVAIVAAVGCVIVFALRHHNNER